MNMIDQYSGTRIMIDLDHWIKKMGYFLFVNKGMEVSYHFAVLESLGNWYSMLLLLFIFVYNIVIGNSHTLALLYVLSLLIKYTDMIDKYVY